MLRPGRSLFIAALVSFFCGITAFFFNDALFLWHISILISLPFAVLDAVVLLLWTNRLTVKRRIESCLVLNIRTKIELEISAAECKRSIIPFNFMLFDIYDDLFECDVFPVTLRGPKTDGSVIFYYEAVPVERGKWTFPSCELLIPSVLRFWRLKVRHNTVSCGKIYPDFRMLADSADLHALLERSGEKSLRKRGDGLEFDHLGGWQPGDSIRAVDWRATSRRGSLIVRHYIEEQDQQILFMLDSGYRLHRQFDAALNASILLAWAALKHGDAVGGALFGGEERWIAPGRGSSALSGLINSLYDVKSAYKPSSLVTALEMAICRLKRRSFLVLISNFREEDEEPLSVALRRAGTRHLLLLVNVREPEVDLLANREGAKGEDALVSKAARAYLQARLRLFSRWEAMGFLTLDSTAQNLSASLINRYLKVKRSGRL
ncbi:MAG: DUF58 domain-containing protein [Spirochaetaceae bacterium]|jgi:uncharacterized protein (DUF58 family)|nr:DUF58 domain-containing protein [Spirochaetaceae bacterium]